MAVRDRRGRRWLPPAGIAALVALTVLDVALIRLAFDHVDRPVETTRDAARSTGPDRNGSKPAGSATPSSGPSESASAATAPTGPLLLALAPDGTVVRAVPGSCEDGTDPEVAIAQPGTDGFRSVPVAADLGEVLALRTDGRDELVAIGADRDCDVGSYRGGADQRTWTSGTAEDEWYLDGTREPAQVHAPGGRVEVPCAPVALSTLDAVRLLCDSGALVGTGDGGATWVALGRLEDAAAMAFQGPGRGFALATSEDCPVSVLATDNGGAAWESTGCLEGQVGRAVALRGDVVVAVVGETLWRSADGGETWERQGG